MAKGVGRYEVTKGCYVPVGPGLKFKRPGQVVTLDDDDAAELSDYVTPAKETKGVAKRATAKSASKAKPEPVEPPEEVKSDAGEPEAADGRAADKTVE